MRNWEHLPSPPRNKALPSPTGAARPAGSTEEMARSSQRRRGTGAPAQHFPFPRGRAEGGPQEMLLNAAEMSSSGTARDPPCGAGEARNGMETVGEALGPVPRSSEGRAAPSGPAPAPALAGSLTGRWSCPSGLRALTLRETLREAPLGEEASTGGDSLGPLRLPRGGGRGRTPDTGRQTRSALGPRRPPHPGPL